MAGLAERMQHLQARRALRQTAAAAGAAALGHRPQPALPARSLRVGVLAASRGAGCGCPVAETRKGAGPRNLVACWR